MACENFQFITFTVIYSVHILIRNFIKNYLKRSSSPAEKCCKILQERTQVTHNQGEGEEYNAIFWQN